MGRGKAGTDAMVGGQQRRDAFSGAVGDRRGGNEDAVPTGQFIGRPELLLEPEPPQSALELVTERFETVQALSALVKRERRLVQSEEADDAKEADLKTMFARLQVVHDADDVDDARFVAVMNEVAQGVKVFADGEGDIAAQLAQTQPQTKLAQANARYTQALYDATALTFRWMAADGVDDTELAGELARERNDALVVMARRREDRRPRIISALCDVGLSTEDAADVAAALDFVTEQQLLPAETLGG